MTTSAAVGRYLRGARAAVFAAACVGLSAAGHVWMSGAAIPLWAVALAFAVIAAAGYVLAGRQRGFLTISALMLVGELGQHFLFTSAQGRTSSTAEAKHTVVATIPALPAFLSGRIVPASAWICGMGKDHIATASGPGSFGARLAMDLMRGHDGLGMVAAHVVAGLLCAWWLRCGDASVFRLLRTLAVLAAPALLLIWPATLIVPDLLRTLGAPSHGRVLGPYNRLLATVVARRGPPSSRLCVI